METEQSGTQAESEPPAVPFDRDFWDGRWSGVLREHADQVAQRPPNAFLTAIAGGLPVDPVTGAETPAAGQVQVTVEAAVAVLDAPRWELSIAEERPRAVAGSGFDAVICAQRRT